MSGKSEKDDPQSQRTPYRLKNRAPKKGHAIILWGYWFLTVQETRLRANQLQNQLITAVKFSIRVSDLVCSPEKTV